jgi:2-polyprenyl-6-methoxyphenol hydroxylase-like FAD-dependent oxidoreductase
MAARILPGQHLVAMMMQGWARSNAKAKRGNLGRTAGAGPTGLALAAELVRRGTRPLIIDRQSAGANTSRACVVHARTLEVLEPLGATRDLLEQGVKVPIFGVRDRDRSPITVDFAEVPSAFPFTLMCPQDRVERCLLRHLEKRGGGGVRPCELIHVEASESHISATWYGARAFTSTMASRKARARVGLFSAAMPRTCTAPLAVRA